MKATYTDATIINSKIAPNMVHIKASDPIDETTIFLTRDEFLDNLKTWLRSMPEEQRQLILDELTACTLRTC